MKDDEIVFAIGDNLYPIGDLDKLDNILREEFLKRETTIRRKFTIEIDGIKKFKIEQNQIEAIIQRDFNRFEHSIKQGFIHIFQIRPNAKSEWENPLQLGKFTINAAKEKFS